MSGCVGPRGDGYQPTARPAVAEARAYHAPQVAALAAAGVDVVSALTLTLTYVEEAIGIVQAAQAADVPVVLSFTVETDGRLPDGSALGNAVLGVAALQVLGGCCGTGLRHIVAATGALRP